MSTVPRDTINGYAYGEHNQRRYQEQLLLDRRTVDKPA